MGGCAYNSVFASTLHWNEVPLMVICSYVSLFPIVLVCSPCLCHHVGGCPWYRKSYKNTSRKVWGERINRTNNSEAAGLLKLTGGFLLPSSGRSRDYKWWPTNPRDNSSLLQHNRQNEGRWKHTRLNKFCILLIFSLLLVFKISNGQWGIFKTS